MFTIGTEAAIVATLFWIISGTASKKIVRGLGSQRYIFIILSLGSLPALFATLLVGNYSIGYYDIIISAVSGIFLTLGFVFMYMSLKTEQLANSSALNALQPAVLVLFGLVVLGEHASVPQIIGMLVIFSGAFMIITTKGFTINKRLFPAALSAASWAVYWIIITLVIDNAHTYALPIFISRIAGLAVAAAYLYYSKTLHGAFSKSFTHFYRNRTLIVLLSLAVIGALADGSGDTVFGITIGNNVLAIGAALSAFSPMMVPFLAFIFYKEKLTRLQFLGLLAMVAGGIIVSVL